MAIVSVGHQVLRDVGEVVEVVSILTCAEDVADGVLTYDSLKHTATL